MSISKEGLPALGLELSFVWERFWELPHMVALLCTKCLIWKYTDFGDVLSKWSLKPCLPRVAHFARLEHGDVTWQLKLVQGFVSAWISGRMAILDLYETSLGDFDLLEDFNKISVTQLEGWRGPLAEETLAAKFVMRIVSLSLTHCTHSQ